RGRGQALPPLPEIRDWTTKVSPPRKKVNPPISRVLTETFTPSIRNRSTKATRPRDGFASGPGPSGEMREDVQQVHKRRCVNGARSREDQSMGGVLCHGDTGADNAGDRLRRAPCLRGGRISACRHPGGGRGIPKLPRRRQQGGRYLHGWPARDQLGRRPGPV